MDNSQVYIKMCEKAEVIQPCLDNEDGVGGTWVSGHILYHTAPMNQPHDKDGYYHVTDEMAIRRCEKCGSDDDYIKSSRAVWLPRQDQLQDMLADYSAKEQEMVRTRTDLMQAFLDFIHWMDTQYYESKHVCLPTNVFSSGEQLWLAFIMKEIYNKVWDGEEWM